MGSAGQQANEVAVARGVARPPLLYLACLLLGFALDRVLPLPLALPAAVLFHWTVGGGLILIGAAISRSWRSSRAMCFPSCCCRWRSHSCACERLLADPRPGPSWNVRGRRRRGQIRRHISW
jgi:hypothetical protein